MNRYLPFIFITILFFILKLGGLGVKISDTNIYFYTAYQLLEGKILYKDIFFTNFPLIPYAGAFYFWISKGNLQFYYITALFEIILTGFFIYIILQKQTKQLLLPSLATALYFFSFIILATSNHQTGVFLASLFSVISYFFFIKMRYFLCGFFIGLTLLAKAYFLPIFVALSIAIIFQKKIQLPNVLSFFLGTILSTVVILAPSLIFARDEIYTNIITYSLTRSQGIPKTDILRFFLIHDFLFVVFWIINALLIRKYLYFGILSISSFALVILYQDVYYLYLTFIIPFLCLSLPNLLEITRKFSLQKMIIPTIIVAYCLLNIIVYLNGYQHLGKIPGLENLVVVVKKMSPPALYGTNDITPAIAYLTNTPLLNGIVDTNENIFRKGFLSREKLTSDAIDKHAIFVTNGAVYPQYNYQNYLLGGIFDEKQIGDNCEVLISVLANTEGQTNRVNLIQCKK